MAEFAEALGLTLLNEGGFADRRSTTGEVVNHGVTHWSLRRLGLMPGVPVWTPRIVPCSDVEVDIVKSLQPGVVETIYKVNYWDRIRCGEIRWQPLANKLFDLHVNTGQGPKLLQRAYNELNWPGGPVLQGDGIIGRQTLDAVNEVDGRIMLGYCSVGTDEGTGLRGEAEKYYRRIGGGDLEAWLTRLRRE